MHNVNYWNFGDYLGIGAGAHAKLSGADCASVRRRWKIRAPNAYLAHAGTPRSIGGDDAVADAQRPFEFMLNALRLTDGVPLARFAQHTGLAATALSTAVKEAQRRGWLVEDPALLRPTALGQRFLNDVIGLFLP